MTSKLQNFTDVLGDPDEIGDSQPLSLSSTENFGQNHRSSVGEITSDNIACDLTTQANVRRPEKGTGQRGEFRSVEEIDVKYRNVFTYPFFNLVQSRVIEDALYSDKSMVICAPTGSGKTVVFEMAIVRLLMELEDRHETDDFKIIYMAPVKALCTERLSEWYPKFTKLGLLCIEVTGDTDVDFSQLKPYRIIITTPEKWDMLTRRWRDHRQLVEMIKLFLIDEVHILNDESRGPVLEAVVSRMKTIETSVQSTHRIEQLQQQYHGTAMTRNVSPSIRFVAVSATVSNPEDVATWLGTTDKPAVYYKFGDECRPVKLRRVVEGYHCAEGTSIFKFDLVLNYKLWPIIQKYHNGKPTLIFCNTRKSVAMTAETLSREITISFNEEQRARLSALASSIKNKKLQTLVLSGVGCHHAGLLYEERNNIEKAFRNRDLPILITTTTLAMGVNLPAHLVIVKNTQQYVSGAYQEYSISTVLQMVGRAGRPQFDTEATAVIMTRLCDKPRYQALVGGSEPLQSYLHKRVPENLNSEAALGTVTDVAQCVQWLRSTFLSVRAAQDPKRYLGLPPTAPQHQITKKIEELCVKAMNGLASSGLITMDEACCIESTEAGRLMSIYYLDLETMKQIMKIGGTESIERLLWIVCESHELSDMHLRMDERRCLNTLNRNNAAAVIRFPMKGKINTRQMKLNCVIQAILGCLPIPDPSLNQEATKIMRIADRVSKCLVAYVTRPDLICQQPQYYLAVLNAITLAKCILANVWENSPFVCKQLRGIGPTFSTLLATAGKVNFMLLEESHPRDLERIMNKGPPAGNILRKQISLLPKYQLTMTPVDEKVVSMQLVLLNHHNLSENMEHLTAGTAHKSYIIIGDSENILLQLTSFSDKDLIGVYDGSITYQITRKHGFEHKIFAHCVSSTFAGIDAQCEYVFKDIEPQTHPHLPDNTEDPIKKPVKKQTTITDTFRERKRKNTDNEIAQSKEKKKRESALFEKFKNLKESFGKTSKVLKDDLDMSVVMSGKILQELTHLDKDIPSAFDSTNVSEQNNKNNEPVKSSFFEEPTTYEINDDDFTNDALMDEDKINDILNEIECEITKVNNESGLCDQTKSVAGNDMQKSTISRPVINAKSILNKNSQIDNKAMKINRRRVLKPVPKKTNYNFIDLLEKNIDLSDTEETTVQEQNSFSDTIRSHIQKYLQKTETNVKPRNRVLDLIQDEPIPSKEIEPMIIVHDSNVIDKENDMGELDKTTWLTSNSMNNEKLTITDGDEARNVNDKLQEVSLLEHKIRSIDLTMDELQNIGSLNMREIEEENELPEVKLHRENYNIAVDKVESAPESRIHPEYNHTDYGSNMNIGTVSLPNTTMKPTDAKNDHIDKLKELHINKQESVSGEDVSHIDNRQNYSGIDRNNMCVTIPRPTPLLNENTECAGVKQPNQVDIVLKKSENGEVMTYNNPSQITSIKQTIVEQNFNYKAIALPITSYVPQPDEQHERHALELWKNYIKEIPPLPFEENNKETTAYNNFIAWDIIDIQKSSTEPVDNCQEQPVSQRPDVKEKQANTEIAKPKNKGFMPPYKHPTASIKTLQSANILNPSNNERPLEIEQARNCTGYSEMTASEVSGTFSNPSISNEQKYKPPLVLSKTAGIPVLQNRLSAIEQAHNNRMTAIQNYPTYTQLHYGNNKVQFNLPSTNSFNSEIQEQGLLNIQSMTKFNKEVTAHNNQTRCAIGNRQYFSEQNYGSSDTNEEPYINKYSFTSSKTDVLTQETTDHVVHVVRNLRIDLDITEIFSKGKTSNLGADIYEQLDRNEKYSNLVLQRYTHRNTSAIQSANHSSAFGNTTKPLEKCNPKTLSYPVDLPAISRALESQPPQALPAAENKQLKSGIEHREAFQEDKDNEEYTNTFSTYKIEDLPEENKPNNVMGILQKYSNIMRTSTSKSADTQTQVKVTDKTTNAAKKDKPKRPFKISDIHHLTPAPLPGVLKESTLPVKVSECFNMLEPKNKHAQLERNKRQNIISGFSSLKQTVEHEYNDPQVAENESTDEHIEDISYSDSYNEDLEVKDTASTIDQTMFNPKTLLQCFSNDEPEDIVPPPPEFSDFLDTTDTSTDVTLPADSYEPMAWEETEHSQEAHGRSIFLDNSQVELTPSKEIETWNLSQDVGNCRTYASPGLSPYSFTIMRKNKEQTHQRPLDGSLLQNMTLPRHKRLQQFKFNNKNKFKM